MPRHRIKFEDSSHALTTDLGVRLGVPTTASVCLKDENGAHLLNGTIDGVTDAGGGTCTFAYTGHTVAIGDIVTVADTTSYNDDQTVTGVVAGVSFDATETFVDDETGTYEITAASATVLTATTISAAASAGEDTITAAAVTSFIEGYPLRIAMSSDGPSEDVIIQNVNTSTKVCMLEDRLRYDHTTAAALTGRRLSYTLDASQSDFTSGLDFFIYWELTDTDDPAWREDAEILKYSPALGGLERRFKALYPHYYLQIPSGEFDTYKTAAFEDLRILFRWTAQRDIDKLVNPDEVEPVLSRQIAYNIALAGDDAWKEERLAMKMERDDWLARMSKAQIWIDANQDGIKTDGETQTMETFHRRNLF